MAEQKTANQNVTRNANNAGAEPVARDLRICSNDGEIQAD